MKKIFFKKNIIIISLIFIIIITTLILLFNYLEQRNKNDTNLEIQKQKQTQESERQRKLQDCIYEAKNLRTSLWNSNCRKSSDDSCKIEHLETVKWIEQRYEQDLDNCYQLYGN